MGWWPKCGMEAGSPEARRAVRRLVWAAVGLSMVAGAAMIGVAAVLKVEPGMPVWLRGGIALTPLLPFAGMFALLVRMNRYMDEFAVRVQFEALSATVIASILLVLAWGQLQKAGALRLTEVSAVWPAMVVIYAACYWLAQRRYR